MRWCSSAGRTARGRCGTWSASRPGSGFRSSSGCSAMIPGLGDAEFLRYGSIHRNTYLNSPASARSGAHRARATAPALLRRAAHRRRGLHRVARHRPPGRDQPRAPARRPAARRAAADHDARRALPLSPRGRPEALPADERQLRPAGAAAGQGEEGRKKASCWPSARWRNSRAWMADAVKRSARSARAARSAQAVVEEFSLHLEKERDQSPHTVKAYGRDLEAFTEFCDRYYGGRVDWDLGGPARTPRLPRRAAAAGLAERTRGARALGGAELLPLPPGAPRRRQRSPPARPRCPSSTSGCRPTSTDETDQRSSTRPKARATEGRVRAALRDLAMLELFYSSGHPALGAARAQLEDLDLLADQVKVRGKGRKERIVPVGSRAVQALRRYLHAPRIGGRADRAADRQAVFVSRRGQRLAPATIQRADAPAVRRGRAATGCGCTRSGTPSRRTCWTRARTCGRCRSCWATRR